jgi:hypothetical protein
MGALNGADAGQRQARLSVSDRESLRFTVRSGTQGARQELVARPADQMERLTGIEPALSIGVHAGASVPYLLLHGRVLRSSPGMRHASSTRLVNG